MQMQKKKTLNEYEKVSIKMRWVVMELQYLQSLVSQTTL